jgi:hypothetical protein
LSAESLEEFTQKIAGKAEDGEEQYAHADLRRKDSGFMQQCPKKIFHGRKKRARRPFFLSDTNGLP